MTEGEIVLEKLNLIEQKLTEQNILKKDVLNFKETSHYLSLSSSHLYKLTSGNNIPYYCPQGKKLYFERSLLDQWMLRNRVFTNEEIEKEAVNYMIEKGHGRR